MKISSMNDGLYQVSWRNICAGFVIENGKITACAPILRRRFDFFKQIAKPISHDAVIKRKST
jgi:hypothetical protein